MTQPAHFSKKWPWIMNTNIFLLLKGVQKVLKTIFPENCDFPQFSWQCSHLYSNNLTNLPFYMVCYHASEPIWVFCTRSVQWTLKGKVYSKIKIPCFFENLSIKGYVNNYLSGPILNKVRRWGYSLSPWATFNTNITPTNVKLSWE